jgi:hypothetical protein
MIDAELNAPSKPFQLYEEKIYTRLKNSESSQDLVCQHLWKLHKLI